jgi:hypothetical protein
MFVLSMTSTGAHKIPPVLLQHAKYFAHFHAATIVTLGIGVNKKAGENSLEKKNARREPGVFLAGAAFLVPRFSG